MPPRFILSQFMDKDEICALLATLGRVLNSLKLLEVKTSSEELESIVMRAFLESHLDYRKGMTTYEVTEFSHTGYYMLLTFLSYGNALWYQRH